MDHVPQLQVHLTSLPLPSLALQGLTHRLLPTFLPTCIYSVMSCPVPSKQTFQTVWLSLRPKLSVKRPKSLDTQRTPSLMSLFVCHPHRLLHLELYKESSVITTQDLWETRPRKPSQDSQRRMRRTQWRPTQSRRQQGSIQTCTREKKSSLSA